MNLSVLRLIAIALGIRTGNSRPGAVKYDSRECSTAARGLAFFCAGTGLGGSAFVMMVQTAHFRQLDYFAFAKRFYSSCLRGVFA